MDKRLGLGLNVNRSDEGNITRTECGHLRGLSCDGSSGYVQQVNQMAFRTARQAMIPRPEQHLHLHSGYLADAFIQSDLQ